jgi:hypothetical protein
MGDKHCFAVGTVGGDVAVDVGEVVLLVGGHYLPSVFAFRVSDIRDGLKQCL